MFSISYNNIDTKKSLNKRKKETKSEEMERELKKKARRSEKNYGLLSIFIFDFIVFLPPCSTKKEKKDRFEFVDHTITRKNYK